MLVKFLFIVGQRVTKAHWVNSLPKFKHKYVIFFENYIFIKTVVAMIFIKRDTKAHYFQKRQLVLLHFHNVCLILLDFKL